MFQQQPPSQQMIQHQQRKEQQQFISAESQAREKLSHYVYEYLMHIGAVKTADMFKNEVLVQTNSGNTNFQIDTAPPGFLFNWFSVFWDLYSAHPDKKDKAESSNEAKNYHKMMFPPCQFPEGIVNGGYGPPGFPNPNMGAMTGPAHPDGMFPSGYFGGPRMGTQPGSSQSNQASPIPGVPSSRYTQQATRSGAPTPVGIGNNFQSPGHPQTQINAIAMNDQMRIVAQQHRQAAAAAQQGRLQMNLPPTGPHGKQIRPQFGNQYMGSPSGTPPFSNQNPHNGTLMSPNASMPGQIPMTSTGSSGPILQPNDGGAIGQEAARFMMSGGGNIQSQFINHDAPGSTGALNAGPGSVSAGINTGGNANIGVGNGQEGELVTNNGNETGSNTQLHSLLNGATDMSIEMKQSPVFSSNQQSGGVNGGTPINASGISAGSNTGAGGGGPGSVHSQSSGTNNQHQGQVLQTTPLSESIDIGSGSHQSDEISRIKASLMEGFQ